MKRFRSERGGAGVGLLIAVVVFLFIAYEAKQFGPHVMAQFQFQDAVVEAAKFSRGKTAGAVQQEVLAKATELGLPVSRDMTAKEVTAEYEWETGEVIVKTFAERGINPLEIPAVLVRNHGPFTWGSSGAKAVETALALEVVAEMALKALQINPQAPRIAQHLLDKHYLRKHGANAYYGQK